MKLPEEQIKKIAELLDCGFSCYVHKTSLEIISILNELKYHDTDFDPDTWEEDIRKVKKNSELYIQIESLESRDAFNLMADFTNQLKDEDLRSKLISALNHKKPFSHFKFVIDHSGPSRQDWFDFKAARLQELVRDRLEADDFISGE